MVAVVRVHQTGGPEMLRYEDIPAKEPGQGEIKIKQTAIGLNYIDTYFRSGLYPAQLPFIAGNEGAGVVTAVGPGVKGIKKGDRVAYVFTLGAYAAERVLPAERAVKIPPKIDDKTAAAMMLKGMTAQYLLRRVYKVKKGDTILVHAAAGGVGDPLPVGAAPRRHRHRHRRLQGEGRARAPKWRAPHHSLQRGKLGRARRRNHPRQEMRRGL